MSPKEMEVAKILDQDFKNYYTAVYRGLMPDGVIELFKKALFAIPPQSHQIHTSKMWDILGKKDSELLVGEIGLVTNIILNSPPHLIYDSFDKFIKMQGALEKLITKFNDEVKDFQFKMEKKKVTLLAISGVQSNPSNILAKA